MTMYLKTVWDATLPSVRERYRTSLIQTGAKLDELQNELDKITWASLLECCQIKYTTARENKEAFCRVIAAEKEAILEAEGAKAVERILDARQRAMPPYPESSFDDLFDFLRSADGVSDDDVDRFETMYDAVLEEWQIWETLPSKHNAQLPPAKAIDISAFRNRFDALTTVTVEGNSDRSSAVNSTPSADNSGRESPDSLAQSDDGSDTHNEEDRRVRRQEAMERLKGRLYNPNAFETGVLASVFLSPLADQYFGKIDAKHAETKNTTRSGSTCLTTRRSSMEASDTVARRGSVCSENGLLTPSSLDSDR
jgi:hypothetical protein